MAVPLSNLPETPLNLAMAPILGNIVPLVADVTLSTPTTATLITGLTLQITVPTVANFVGIFLQGQDAIVSAAATVTLTAYTGATTGALTTAFDARLVVAPTGGTTVAVNTVFWLPVTNAVAGTTFFVSIAATASSGNFVLKATSVNNTNLIAVCY